MARFSEENVAVAREIISRYPVAKSALIPLCHPLSLTYIDVRLDVGETSVEIEAVAETVAGTGVEMEALVAVTVAALTVYDMAKGIDKEMTIEEVRLVEKTKELV